MFRIFNSLKIWDKKIKFSFIYCIYIFSVENSELLSYLFNFLLSSYYHCVADALQTSCVSSAIKLILDMTHLLQLGRDFVHEPTWNIRSHPNLCPNCSSKARNRLRSVNGTIKISFKYFHYFTIWLNLSHLCAISYEKNSVICVLSLAIFIIVGVNSAAIAIKVARHIISHIEWSSVKQVILNRCSISSLNFGVALNIGEGSACVSGVAAWLSWKMK